MKFTIDMPKVAECAVTKCAYNIDESCHARAITIGDHGHPQCDTFLEASSHTRSASTVAGVGACKATDCRHNDDYECTASSIELGAHEGHADCLTFEV